MVFLCLAVACSLGIATLFKLAEHRDLDRTALLAANYAAAAALAVGLDGAAAAAMPTGAAVLGAVEGVLYIGGFWLFARAIREAGIGLAASAMRLSVVVPVVAAWAVWGEAPTLVQGAGLALAGLAFVLVARPSSVPDAPQSVVGVVPAASSAAALDAPMPSRPAGAAVLLGTLFVVGGLVDVGMKAFQTGYGEASAVPVPPSAFLLVVFGVAFVVGAIAVVTTGFRTGRWPGPAVAGWGAGLGVLNYASADFLLRALDIVPAPVAFPLNNVSIVLGAALLGSLVWGERLSRANAAGLGLAAVAVALLAG